MRKPFITAALFAVCAVSLAAQEGAGASASTTDINKYKGVGLLNVDAYSKHFLNKQTNMLDNVYVSVAADEDFARIAFLGGDKNAIDTAEEIALLSAAAGVINARPAEAAGMLPAGDPVLADLQLGAMLYMKKAMAGFLGNGDADKYAAELKFITAGGRVTEADIESFVKQGIAAAANVEFNRISFVIDRDYNAVLTYNLQNGQYELSYRDMDYITKKLTTNSLEELSSAMSISGDFSAMAFNTVVNNAVLMPSISRIKDSKVTSLVLFTEIVAGFYTAKTPEDQNRYYKALLGFDARLQSMIMAGEGNFAEPITRSWAAALFAINPELAGKATQNSLNLGR
jgi:hypothetical protein